MTTTPKKKKGREITNEAGKKKKAACHSRLRFFGKYPYGCLEKWAFARVRDRRSFVVPVCDFGKYGAKDIDELRKMKYDNK